MSDNNETDNNSAKIPKEIQALRDRAAKSVDLVERMRNHWNAAIAAKNMIYKLNRITKDHEAKLKSVETEIEFMVRHKVKEDMAYRALRATYSAPERALSTFNELCRTYEPDYVKDVIKLGSYRLGAVVGMSLLGMKMGGRLEAESSFETAVLPALMNIVDDQKAFLELKATNLEQENAGLREHNSAIAAQRVSLEAVIRECESESKDAATSMLKGDIDRLDGDEVILRLSLLSEKQRSAEIGSTEGR